jgi:hypothetical protein
MKKYLTLLSCILFIGMSCKKDKSEPVEPPVVNLYKDEQLIGKWVYQTAKVNGISSPYVHRSGCAKDCFYFLNRTSQDHDYMEMIHLNANCAINQTYMKWRVKGENLILAFGAQEITYKILRLTETNFDVLIRSDYDGDGKLDDLEIYATREKCTGGDPFCQN